MTTNFRVALQEFIRNEAKPIEKYGHQPRLYALTRQIAWDLNYDDDVVFAAAWLHDLGVFVGHRPEDPVELARWDHVRYACERRRFCTTPDSLLKKSLRYWPPSANISRRTTRRASKRRFARR